MTHMKAFGLEIFRGPRFASPSRVTDVDKQLAEHDDWRGWYFLRLEPHFFGFNIDQTLEDGLQAERLDVGVFDIFLGLRASKGSE